MYGIEFKDRFPDPASWIDSLGMEQPFKKMYRDIQMLVRQGENREQPCKPLAGLLPVPSGKKLIDQAVDLVQAGSGKIQSLRKNGLSTARAIRRRGREKKARHARTDRIVNVLFKCIQTHLAIRSERCI